MLSIDTIRAAKNLFIFLLLSFQMGELAFASPGGRGRSKTDGAVSSGPLVHARQESLADDWLLRPDKKRIGWCVTRRVKELRPTVCQSRIAITSRFSVPDACECVSVVLMPRCSFEAANNVPKSLCRCWGSPLRSTRSRSSLRSRLFWRTYARICVEAVVSARAVAERR